MFNSTNISVEIQALERDDAVFPERPNWFNYIAVSMKAYDMPRKMSFVAPEEGVYDSIWLLTRRDGYEVITENTRQFLNYCSDQIRLIYKSFINEADKENLRHFRQLKLTFTQEEPKLTEMQESIIKGLVKRKSEIERRTQLSVKMGVYHSNYVPKFESARSYMEKYNLKTLKEFSEEMQGLFEDDTGFVNVDNESKENDDVIKPKNFEEKNKK